MGKLYYLFCTSVRCLCTLKMFPMLLFSLKSCVYLICEYFSKVLCTEQLPWDYLPINGSVSPRVKCITSFPLMSLSSIPKEMKGFKPILCIGHNSNLASWEIFPETSYQASEHFNEIHDYCWDKNHLHPHPYDVTLLQHYHHYYSNF